MTSLNTLTKICFLEIKEYISKPNKKCEYTKRIAEYSTLPLAQQACSANVACKAVTDYNCDGLSIWTCKTPKLLKSSFGSCSWLKGMKIGI